MLLRKGVIAVALLMSSSSGFGQSPDAGPSEAVSSPKPVTIPALATADAERGLLLSVARAGGRLVAVGGNGVIVKSEDGSTWSQVLSPVDLTLTGLAFGDDKNGWAVGHDAVILHTSDGGLHWDIQSYEPDLNSPFFAVIASSADSAIAVGAFGLMRKTTDGGKTWTKIDPAQVVEESFHLNAATLLPNGRIAVAGEHGLVAFQSSATDWARSVTPYEGSFFGILPWGSAGAIAFGMRGNVFAIDNLANGQWRKIDAGTSGSFFGGEALSNGAVALVGADGQMIRIDANGTSRELAKSISVPGKASSLAGAVRGKDELVVVGELGVHAVKLQ